MPIDYKNYPPNWKTEIRPAILKRADNCCEFCLVPNYMVILRGEYDGRECYQDTDGNIYCARTSECIGSDYVGTVHPTNTFIKVILTIAHLDQDVTNNDYSNLRALCQKCHLSHDEMQHRLNSRETRKNKLGLIELDFN